MNLDLLSLEKRCRLYERLLFIWTFVVLMLLIGQKALRMSAGEPAVMGAADIALVLIYSSLAISLWLMRTDNRRRWKLYDHFEPAQRLDYLQGRTRMIGFLLIVSTAVLVGIMINFYRLFIGVMSSY